MLSFKKVRINQRNLYDYLKSHKDEIDAELKLDQRHRVQEIDEIWNDRSLVVVCGINLNLYDNPKFLTILSIDCNSADICSEICDGKILLDYYIRIKVQDLFEYDIIDAKVSYISYTLTHLTIRGLLKMLFSEYFLTSRWHIKLHLRNNCLLVHAI